MNKVTHRKLCSQQLHEKDIKMKPIYFYMKIRFLLENCNQVEKFVRNLKCFTHMKIYKNFTKTYDLIAKPTMKGITQQLFTNLII